MHVAKVSEIGRGGVPCGDARLCGAWLSRTRSVSSPSRRFDNLPLAPQLAESDDLLTTNSRPVSGRRFDRLDRRTGMTRLVLAFWCARVYARNVLGGERGPGALPSPRTSGTHERAPHAPPNLMVRDYRVRSNARRGLSVFFNRHEHRGIPHDYRNFNQL